MRRSAAIVAVIAVALLAGACSSANRPEGNAERFLRAVSRGVDAEEIERHGTMEAAAEVVGDPDWETKEESQDSLDAIEVAPATIDGDSATVPARVTRKGEDDPTDLALQMELDSDGDWQVVDVGPLTTPVTFPSEGGPSFGIPTSQVALLTLAVFAGAIILSTLAVKFLAGRPPHGDLAHDEAVIAAESVVTGADAGFPLNIQPPPPVTIERDGQDFEPPDEPPKDR